MRFKVDLRNYKIVEIPLYIREETVDTINFDELADEITEFNREIQWDGMWTLEDAKNRLLDSWRLIVFVPGVRIKGWYWLDNTQEPRNIYVNRRYRGLEIGKEFNFKLLNICKDLGMDEVECSVDDWNVKSQSCFKKAGWSEVTQPNTLQQVGF
jgi:RimJ/RimL family protein N-acetyltransferase